MKKAENKHIKLKYILLLIIISSTCFHVSAQTAEEHYGDGLYQYSTGNYTQALEDFSKAIKANNKYGDAYRERGFTYIALKKMDEAFIDLNKAITINGKDYRAYYGRGIVYESRKDGEALSDYETSKEDPTLFVDAYNRIGLILCNEGSYEPAIGYYKRAMKFDTLNNTPCLIINIIEPLLRVRKFEEALKYINDNSSENKQVNFSAYTNTLKADDKNAKDASWNFFKQELKPSIENLKKKDFASAIKTLTESESRFTIIKESDPDYQKQSYALLLSLKGYAFEQQRKIKEAIKCYEQTLVIQPNQQEVTASLNKLEASLAIELRKDTAKPKITILEPLSRSISVGTDKVATTLQHFRGTVTDDNGLKSVMLNNTPLSLAANGYFDTTVNLQPGPNAFVIVATDNNANTIISQININASADPVANNDKNTLSEKPVYHAVLIAENEYKDKNIPSLRKPVSDMRLIYNTLIKDYTFDPANIDTLVNASRIDILTALTKKGETIKEGENLLIFYAGHGDLLKNPDNSEESFLIPEDAVLTKTFTYINGEEFLKSMRFTKAKHILVVADACFAGSLFRGLGKSGNQSLSEKYKDISRRLLSSGNVKVVPDNSEFIPFFLDALKKNTSPFITAEKLVDGFKEQYNIKANQQLQFLPIDYLNDQGGQFVFIRKQ